MTMLSSLLDPDSGSAAVCGHEIVRDNGGVTQSTGHVFEEEAVEIYHTGKEN